MVRQELASLEFVFLAICMKSCTTLQRSRGPAAAQAPLRDSTDGKPYPSYDRVIAESDAQHQNRI